MLILLYFLLLVAEGAFRKWITPGLSAPLLLVRDPVVILIYAIALLGGFFPRNLSLIVLAISMVITATTGLLAETFNIKIYLFGLRTNYLHFPLIFLVGKLMTYADVVKLGKWIVILSLPMTYLVARQFSGAPDDVINAAAGGSLGQQLGTAGGKVRASGTFSYVAGVIGFYGLVAGFLLNSFFQPATYSRWLQLIGTACLFVAVVTSGSRSVVTIVLAACVAAMATAVMKPQIMGRAIVILALVGIVGLGVMQLKVVEEGLEVTQQRFGESGGHAGFWHRLYSPFFPLFTAPAEAPFFGHGLGLGTNVGAGIAEKSAFAMGEDDWSRVILESGPIAGLLFVFWRMMLFLWMLFVSVKNMTNGNLLPVLMLTTAGSFILYGQIGQPTLLGFAAFGGGLCLAAANRSSNMPLLEEEEVAFAPEVSGLGKRRGRSSYAEALHADSEPRL